MDMSGACGTAGDSRWNPTKEQISMLESLYEQGIRTPSADQIQQITSRLKAYGNIEGKNVFYWFQNHKARQRQKQKPQNNMPYINRHLYPPPPGPNVVCGSYFLPQGDLRFYPQTQCPKALLPEGVNRRGWPEKMGKPSSYGGASYGLVHQDYNNTMLPDIENYDRVQYNDNDPETLALFPLHPTGVLETRETLVSPLDSITDVGNSTITPHTSCETTAGIDEYCSGVAEQHFFDFFSCQGSSECD